MINLEAPVSGPVCDFCSSKNPAYAYPAHTFAIVPGEGPIAASVAEWAACKACHDLIEKDDRGALAERAIVLCGFPPIPAFTCAMHELHDVFFAVRNGDPIILLPGMEKGISHHA
jgi:hypothetical protein